MIQFLNKFLDYRILQNQIVKLQFQQKQQLYSQLKSFYQEPYINEKNYQLFQQQMQQEDLNQSITNQMRMQQRQERQERKKILKLEIKKIKQIINDPNPLTIVLGNSIAETCQEIKQLRKNYFAFKKKVNCSGQSLDDQYSKQNQRINQQINQVNSQYQKVQQVLKSKYQLNRTNQVTKDYNYLVTAEFNDLINNIYKEDFDEIESVGQNQMNDNSFELQLSNFRKRIIKEQIVYHLFLHESQVTEHKNDEEMKILDDKMKRHVNNFNNLSNTLKENNIEQVNNQTVVNEQNGKQLELEQQCVRIRDYINLRKTQQEIQNQKSQLEIYQQKEQCINQEIQNIDQKIKGFFEQIEQIKQKNIEDQSNDVSNCYSGIQSGSQEITSLYQERQRVNQSQNEIISQIKDDNTETKLIELEQVIQQYAQIKNFSEQQAEECIQYRMNQIELIKQEKKRIQNSIDICNHNIIDCKARQNEIQIHISELDKKIKGSDLKRRQDRQKFNLIHAKFDQFKEKILKTCMHQFQDGYQFISLMEQGLNQIEDFNKHIFNETIRKKYQDLVLNFQMKEQSRPRNIIFEQYQMDQEENLNKREEQLKQLKDKANKMEQYFNEQRHKLKTSPQNNEAKRSKKAIIKLKQKYSVSRKEFLGIKIQMLKYKQQLDELKMQLISI